MVQCSCSWYSWPGNHAVGSSSKFIFAVRSIDLERFGQNSSKKWKQNCLTGLQNEKNWKRLNSSLKVPIKWYPRNLGCPLIASGSNDITSSHVGINMYPFIQTYSHMPSTASGSVTAAFNTFNTPWLHKFFLNSGYSGYNCTSLIIPDRLMPPSTWKTWRFCGGFRGWWTAQMLEKWPRSAAVETCCNCPCTALNAKTAKAESYINILIKIFRPEAHEHALQ